MRHAEHVTFGGSGLDRAAHLRGDAAALEAAQGAAAIALWKGKPLVAGGTLVRLPMAHPALAAAAPGGVFLGLEEGEPRFALDLSALAPEGACEALPDGFSDTSRQRHPGLPADHVFAELRAVMTRLAPRDAELAVTARAILNWHAAHGFCARCGAASRMAMAGWQRDCDACGAHHFPRTDPVVIMLITRGNSVLLGRSPGWPERLFSLLAGFVEPGETIEAAVRREVAEEAGIAVGPVRYLASQPWPFPASLMIGCAGEALSAEITVDPTEIDEALWAGREEVALAFADGHPRIDAAREGAIAHFLLRNWLADTLC